jgi:hypothetical protein
MNHDLFSVCTVHSKQAQTASSPEAKESALERARLYLERYFYLLTFTSYLLTTNPKGTAVDDCCSKKKKFV